MGKCESELASCLMASGEADKMSLPAPHPFTLISERTTQARNSAALAHRNSAGIGTMDELPAEASFDTEVSSGDVVVLW